MKAKLFVLMTVLTLLGTLGVRAQGTAFTYQGRLDDGPNPANGLFDFSFSVWSAAGGPAQVGPTLTTNAVAVSNGLFTVALDFGAEVFTGPDRWLEIGVRTNGGGAFTTLSPRQPLTPAPYALYTPSAGAAATAATASSASTVAANGVANASLQADAVTTDKIADGTIAAADLSPVLLSNTFWRVAGNAGTMASTHFMGTTDNQPLELRVNNQRGLRLEPAGGDSVNVVGGWTGNSVAPGVVGATVAGGGAGNWGEGQAYTNRVEAHFGTVSGGAHNTIRSFADNATIGGGSWNTIQPNAWEATLGGGYWNTIQTDARGATIGGGYWNTIQTNAASATIGGGTQNTIQTDAWGATIGGGDDNTILRNAAFATIPGGWNNSATNYAFAAGNRAKANHTGGFVWADSTDADFASTATNQFNVRAGGGVRLVTGGAGATLDGQPILAGAVNASQIVPGAVGTNQLADGTVTSAKIADGTIAEADLSPVVLSNTFWRVAGNAGTTAGTHFLGTTDNQPLELKVNNQRGLRLEPAGSNSVNVVGGWVGNSVAPGVVGATIGGGDWNTIQPNAWGTTIGGGNANTILSNANHATIGGGSYNTIQPNAWSATIGGGDLNTIQPNAFYATIPGGRSNNAASYAFAAGLQAKANHIGAFVWADSTGADFASTTNNQFNVRALGGVRLVTSGGGATLDGQPILAGTATNANTPNAIVARDGAGNFTANHITAAGDLLGERLNVGSGHQLTGAGGTIAGGLNNTNQGLHAAIGGGSENTIQPNAGWATIGGGWWNTIQPNFGCATIGGGMFNTIQTNANNSTIGGGYLNTIQPNADYSTIGGGMFNTIQPNADYSTIGGGQDNTIQPKADYATIPGGYENSATNYAFAAGRRAKANHTGTFVWADSTGADFASTTNNQFLIRASGGVGIGATNPAGALTIRSPAGVAPGTMSGVDNPLALGLYATNGYKWIQSYGGPLALNPAGNFVGINLTQALHTVHAGTSRGVGAINAAANRVVVENSATNGRAAFLAVAGPATSANATNRVEVQLEADEGQRRGIFGTTSNHEMQFRINNAEVMNLATNLYVGIGTGTPQAKLDVNGTARVSGLNVNGTATANAVMIGATNLAGGLTIRNPAGAPPPGLPAVDNALALGSFNTNSYKWIQSYGGPLALNPLQNNVGINTTNPATALDVNGTARVSVLEITGGSDLAEPIPTSSGHIPKGALVIIDEENPGHVRLSERAYDNRVAGIASGANGVSPGITLRQEGVLDNGQLIALSGRVYAQADAGYGPIKPGDLLTTSDTPGHAMKVGNPAKAQGAIIGKAMTRLDEGRGLVLVLVSLQ